MMTLSLPERDYIDVLRSQSKQAEQDCSLTAAQLDIIYQQNWFNIYVPKPFGGLGLELPDAVKLIEKLAWIEGSIGWAVTLGSGANLFIGYLHDKLVPLFFNTPKVCIAGSGANTGTAKPVNGGYIINGKWKYATGSMYATAFTANCEILKDDDGSASDDANAFDSFIFDAGEVNIEKASWNGMGMKATCSNTFTIEDLFVPEERRFSIDPSKTVLDDLIFKFPFLQFAEVTLAANFSGMANHFAEECRRIFDNRIRNKTFALEQSSEMLELLGRAMSTIEKNNDIFFDTLSLVWKSGKDKGKWDGNHLNNLSTISKKMVRELLLVIEQLYPYCGMEAADMSSVINRIWRDIHTASQHQLMK